MSLNDITVCTTLSCFDRICMNVVYMSRNYRDTQTRVQDGKIAQTNEETAFLKGKSSSSSADGVDVDYSGTTTSGHQRHPSLIRCLLRVYGLSLLKAHLCKLVCDVLLFIGPVLQK